MPPAAPATKGATPLAAAATATVAAPAASAAVPSAVTPPDKPTGIRLNVRMERGDSGESGNTAVRQNLRGVTRSVLTGVDERSLAAPSKPREQRRRQEERKQDGGERPSARAEDARADERSSRRTRSRQGVRAVCRRGNDRRQQERDEQTRGYASCSSACSKPCAVYSLATA